MWLFTVYIAACSAQFCIGAKRMVTSQFFQAGHATDLEICQHLCICLPLHTQEARMLAP